jgi:tryptophan-rich sensory protein
MSELDKDEWIGLLAILVGHFYSLSIEGQWTSAAERLNYTKWRSWVGTWFAPPGWAFQPLWMMLWAFQAAAIFLLWRNHHDDISGHRIAAIYSLQIATVVLAKLWTPVFLWGKRYFWLATGIAFFVLATAVTVWGLIGYEHAWLPFGLYAPYPVLMAGLPIFSGIFYWFGDLITLGEKGLLGPGRPLTRGFSRVMQEGINPRNLRAPGRGGFL